MGIIEKLTFRYMKKNKKRTKTIILGIAGTMMLLTVVNIFANTFMLILQEKISSKEGNYYAGLHNFTMEDYEKLILLLLVLMGSIVIYNGYAISVFEKLKYLGSIGSIGASKWQKARIVYLEGLIEGMIGVPTGIIMGVVLVKAGIHIIGNLLLYEEQIEIVIDAGLIIKLVLLGFLFP